MEGFTPHLLLREHQAGASAESLHCKCCTEFTPHSLSLLGWFWLWQILILANCFPGLSLEAREGSCCVQELGMISQTPPFLLSPQYLLSNNISTPNSESPHRGRDNLWLSGLGDFAWHFYIHNSLFQLWSEALQTWNSSSLAEEFTTKPPLEGQQQDWQSSSGEALSKSALKWYFYPMKPPNIWRWIF